MVGELEGDPVGIDEDGADVGREFQNDVCDDVGYDWSRLCVTVRPIASSLVPSRVESSSFWRVALFRAAKTPAAGMV